MQFRINIFLKKTQRKGTREKERGEEKERKKKMKYKHTLSITGTYYAAYKGSYGKPLARKIREWCARHIKNRIIQFREEFPSKPAESRLFLNTLHSVSTVSHVIFNKTIIDGTNAILSAILDCCPNVTRLELIDCVIDFYIANDFLCRMQTNKTLEALHIYCEPGIMGPINAIGIMLENNTHLRYLKLAFPNVHAMRYNLARGIRANTTLVKLSLKNFVTYPNSDIDIFEALEENTGIKKLRLVEVIPYTSERCMKNICQNNTTLKSLKITQEDLHVSVLRDIAIGLEMSNSLNKLVINTGVIENGAEMIFGALHKNRGLEVINISCDDNEEPFAVSTVSILRNNPVLRSISVQGISLTDYDPAWQLQLVISSSHVLEKLRLRCTDDAFEKTPVAVRNKNNRLRRTETLTQLAFDRFLPEFHVISFKRARY